MGLGGQHPSRYGGPQREQTTAIQKPQGSAEQATGQDTSLAQRIPTCLAKSAAQLRCDRVRTYRSGYAGAPCVAALDVSSAWRSATMALPVFRSSETISASH